MDVDLPKLTSIINSRGYSFHNPRFVELESTLITLERVIILDIPNVQQVELRDAFYIVVCPITNSTSLFECLG